MRQGRVRAVELFSAGALSAGIVVLTFSALTAMLGRLSEDRGLDLHEASIVIPAVTLGIVLGAVPWGQAADRHGPRAVSGTAFSLAGVALIFAALIPGLLATYVALVAVGVGLGGGIGGMRAVVNAFPSHRAEAIAIPSAIGFAFAAAATVGLGLIAHVSGSGTAMLCLGVLCVGVGVAAALLLPGRDSSASAEAAGRQGALLSLQTFMRYEAPWHVIAMGALLFGLTIGLHSLGVLYLTQVHGLEVSALGVAIAVILVTAALLKGPVSYLVDRVDAPGLVVAGLATALAIASPLVLLGDTVSALVALAGFVVVGTVAELPSPLVKAMVVQRVEQHRIGTALGVQEHARRVAAVIVPTVAGLLAPLITLEVAVAGVLAMAAPSIALAVPVARAERIGGSQAATSG